MINMKYSNLGNSGLKISQFGLGSWLTYGTKVEKEKTLGIFDKAYEAGINFFDTANIYGNGEAERIVGEALNRYPRDSYVLASKAFLPMGPSPNQRGLSRKHLTEQLDKSLKRLNHDYLDIYYCHRFDTETPLEETLRTLDDFIRKGKILYVGVSNWNHEQIEKAIEIADKYLLNRIIVNQPPYNLLNRKIEEKLVLTCEKLGIGQVTYSPLAQGVLTGKYNNRHNIAQDSRAYNQTTQKFMGEYYQEHQLLKVEKLQELATNYNLSLTQISLSWLIHQPFVNSVLLGVSSLEQLLENLNVLNIILSNQILKDIDNLFK